MKSHSESYKAAGVDITAGYEAVERMKRHVARTNIPGVLSGLGGFGALFAPDVAGMREPVLVSGTDGVGTKLKLAFLLDKHDTVGIDCVAMCVNDIVCSGARPLFFLDYIALGKSVPARVEAIVAGVAEGCVQAGCALVGGETAEMPGFYPQDEYDLAGFAVGLVDRANLLDGRNVRAGDAILALPSSGPHSNGFSLIRKVLADRLREHGEALLAPTRIYVKPDIFGVIQAAGDIPERDMFNTFNMGVGMTVIVAPEDVETSLSLLRAAGEDAYVCGRVEPGEDGVALC